MKKCIVTMSASRQFPKSHHHSVILSRSLSPTTIQKFLTSFRTTLCGGLVLLILLTGCEPQQKIDYLKVGRQQQC